MLYGICEYIYVQLLYTALMFYSTFLYNIDLGLKSANIAFIEYTSLVLGFYGAEISKY